jgi:hypothetical protein
VREVVDGGHPILGRKHGGSDSPDEDFWSSRRGFR